ncbi:fruitless-like isoform X5 [Dinothrombium tinctorium]|uniref:Fruitless-like isoform X5 n=1 Tax=Dinothrombium tinctorium TaxID=1965070 RepID=A0A443RAN8_9ACAR|nr:fruitless-like isoform X5 [Dinothrombium tinctorium]
MEFRYESHSQEIANSFCELFKTQSQCDITFVIDGRVIKAHRSIVTIFSPFLRQIFTINSSSSPSGSVSPPSIAFINYKYTHIEAILKYMYTGSIKMSLEEWPSLAKCAQDLGISSISEYYRTKVRAAIDESAVKSERKVDTSVDTTAIKRKLDGQSFASDADNKRKKSEDANSDKETIDKAKVSREAKDRSKQTNSVAPVSSQVNGSKPAKDAITSDNETKKEKQVKIEEKLNDNKPMAQKNISMNSALKNSSTKDQKSVLGKNEVKSEKTDSKSSQGLKSAESTPTSKPKMDGPSGFSKPTMSSTPLRQNEINNDFEIVDVTLIKCKSLLNSPAEASFSKEANNKEKVSEASVKDKTVTLNDQKAKVSQKQERDKISKQTMENDKPVVKKPEDKLESAIKENKTGGENKEPAKSEVLKICKDCGKKIVDVSKHKKLSQLPSAENNRCAFYPDCQKTIKFRRMLIDHLIKIHEISICEEKQS